MYQTWHLFDANPSRAATYSPGQFLPVYSQVKTRANFCHYESPAECRHFEDVAGVLGTGIDKRTTVAGFQDPNMSKISSLSQRRLQ